jgi:hypothetical protein
MDDVRRGPFDDSHARRRTIVSLAMFLAVRENKRKRTQLKRWLLVNVGVLAFIVLYVFLRVVATL